MPRVETSIWLALKSHVESLPFPKAWPAQVFAVPSANGRPQPYLRIGRISVEPVGVFVDYAKPHERSGSLIVTLVYPLGSDVSVYDQIAGDIAAHFVDGTNMRSGNVCVTVPSYPYVNEGYDDNGYWTVPVSIPWRCFA